MYESNCCLIKVDIGFCLLLIVCEFDYFEFGMTATILIIHTALTAFIIVAVGITCISNSAHAIMSADNNTARSCKINKR